MVYCFDLTLISNARPYTFSRHFTKKEKYASKTQKEVDTLKIFQTQSSESFKLLAEEIRNHFIYIFSGFY